MYQIFSNLELARTFDEHVSYACNQSQSFVEFESSNIWTVVGEWSNALTDCAQWLNGRGIGARWEGKWGTASDQQVFGTCQGYTGDSSTFSQQYKDQMRKYFELQIEVGERVQGWVFWTWKVRDYCFTNSPWAVGSNAYRRLRGRTIGAIVKEWQGAGFLAIQRTGFTPIFVHDSTPFFQHHHTNKCTICSAPDSFDFRTMDVLIANRSHSCHNTQNAMFLNSANPSLTSAPNSLFSAVCSDPKICLDRLLTTS